MQNSVSPGKLGRGAAIAAAALVPSATPAVVNNSRASGAGSIRKRLTSSLKAARQQDTDPAAACRLAEVRWAELQLG